MIKYVKLIVLIGCFLLRTMPAYGMEGPRRNKLFEYVKKNDVKSLNTFLSYKKLTDRLNLSVYDSAGWQPIHHAVKSGNREIVKLLIEYGADVNAQIKDSQGERSLHLAARAGNEEIILDLVAAGARPDLADNNGILPMYYAENISALFVDSSANSVGTSFARVNDSSDGDRSRNLYEQLGALSISDEFLLLSPAKKNKETEKADKQAAGRLSSEECDQRLLNTLLRGDLEKAQLCYVGGADINFRDAFGNQPIHHVVNQGVIPTLEWLLVHGADINAQDRDGNRPVRIAALREHAQVAQWLIRQGARCDDRDDQKPEVEKETDQPFFYENSVCLLPSSKNEVLISAVKRGKIKRVQNALAAGAHINAQDSNGQTSLHHAVRAGRLDIVGWLIKHGAQVESRDTTGQEPIHEAVYRGHLEIVQLLVEHGAQVDARDDLKRSSLHLAALGGHLEVVQWLVEHGASIHAQDNDGLQPLHWAAYDGHLEVVKWLVDHGAAINAQDKTGWQPLHWAAVKAHLEVVKWLVEHGAPINAQDNDGMQPLHRLLLRGI